MMKTITFLLVHLICYCSLAQNTSKFDYYGNYDAQVDKKNRTISSISFSLSDSIYFIYFEGKNSEQIEFRNRYIGTFSMDSLGNMNLKGKHPFQRSKFHVQQLISDCNEMERTWGYSKKLDISFEAQIIPELSTKRKGDQMHLLNTRYQSANSPNPHFYGSFGLPFFHPNFYPIYRDVQKRDSLFNSIVSEQHPGAFYSAMLQIQTSTLKPGEQFSFWVDSMCFDTLYINKIHLVTKIKEFTFKSDTLLFNQTVKVPLDYRSVLMYLPEHTALLQEHDINSEIVYDVQEIDRTKHFQIVDYYKDDAGIQWIKIELDMWVKKEDVFEPELTHFEGWMLQKLLDLY